MKATIRVLIMGGAHADRALYRSALEENSAPSCIAVETDGNEQGLLCIDAFRPDCVLFLDSLENLRALRARHPSLPAVTVTAGDDERITAAKAGGRDCIAKSTVAPSDAAHAVLAAVEHAAQQALRKSAEGIAHDFNNLLTVILANTDTLVDELTDRQDLRMLAEMTRAAANRGAELTNDLFTLVRCSVPGLVYAPEPVFADDKNGDDHAR